MSFRRPYDVVLTSFAGWDGDIFDLFSLFCLFVNTSSNSYVTHRQPDTLREKRLNTTPYIPVYGLHVPIYGSNLSEYGKIRDRIQAFFTQCKCL